MARTLGGTKKGEPRPITQKPVKYEPTRMLPAMPLDIPFQAWKAPVALTIEGEESVLTFGETKSPALDAPELVVHGIRETFLGITSPMEALQFFQIAGNFRMRRWEPGNGSDPSRLTWSDFQNWQEIFRQVMQHGWIKYTDTAATICGSAALQRTLKTATTSEFLPLTGVPPSVSIRPHSAATSDGRTELAASIGVFSVLEAIVASLYVDTLNGVRYRLCALPDCRKLYEVTSGHEREYCEKAHAHLASVRRRRAEAKLVGATKAATPVKRAYKSKTAQKGS